MKNAINIEDFKLVDNIILNGKVEYCDTHDENSSTIGIKMYTTTKKLNGTVIETCVGQFPFSKEMEEKCGWSHKYASIQMLTGNTPIDLDHIDETKIVSMMGEVESRYYHRYSDYTGYLWTEEGFICGGHDLLKILQSHLNEYIHIEIELYNK